MPFVVGAEHLGASEDAWLTRSALLRCPTWGDLEHVARARVVVLAPHPDDEVLALGGTLRSLERAGCDLCIVAVTDGEASHPASPTCSPAQMAARRRDERAEALGRLGVNARVVRFGRPDGAVHDSESLVHDLARVMRGAHLCFAPWDRDGHPDHDATGRAALRAGADASVQVIQYPIWAWHWAKPEGDDLPWGRVRRIPLAPEVVPAKRQALEAYASQVAPLSSQPGDEAILPPHVLARFLRPFEVVLT